MVCCRDGAAGALGAAYRPVLVEGGGADNGGLVSTHAEVDVVDGAVRGYGALCLQAGGWVVGAEVFRDVVLDQGPGGPAVDGEVAVAIGLIIGVEGDGAEGIFVSKEGCFEVYREGQLITELLRASSPCRPRGCRRCPR